MGRMAVSVRRVLRTVVPQRFRPWAHTTYMRLRYRGDALAMKHAQELRFWHDEVDAEGGRLYSDHIERTFVECFDVGPAMITGARMLDIGCGPVGSLEWAGAAAVRVGLDPLVDSYRALGIGQHGMTYAAGQAEAMPFRSASFDIVSSFNSLDHVDDLDDTIAEMTRVLAPRGTLLVLVEVNHPPTLTEPVTLGWDVTQRFGNAFDVEIERHLDTSDMKLYDAALGNVVLADPATPEPAGLLVRLRKRT